MQSVGSTLTGALLLVVGAAIGVMLRLLIGHVAGMPPRAWLLWTSELVFAAILGAGVGYPLIEDPASFQVWGNSLSIGLTAYAVTCGVLAVNAIQPRRPIALVLGIAHFFAACAASTVGVLVVVTAFRLG